MLIEPPASCKVYTPAALAEAMVLALGDAPGATWLEPSHGNGAFVEAMARSGVGRDRIFALDLDPVPAAADSLARTLRGVDFLRWAGGTQRRFDRVIGNPPFISVDQLPLDLQASAAQVASLNGQPIGRGANLWLAFVLASIRLLRKGGSLAFILPSSAEFADYCAAIRREVPREFEKVEVYRCTRPLFDNVQEGTLVVIARGYGFGPGVVFRRSFSARATMINRLSIGTPLNSHRCPKGGATSTAGSKVKLGSIATIRLGGVTGDASYFLMNEEKRAFVGLPPKALAPIISKARHLRSALLTRTEWERLRRSGERVWLFNPPATLTDAPAVRRYLELGASLGGCNRSAYKVLIRDPWYRTPMPPTPDAFLSGMGRQGPWLCVNGTRSVNATNTLYVVRFKSRNREDWYKWALALLSSEARRQLRRAGRRYADGLIKYEPSSLTSIYLPQMRADADHKALYFRAVRALLAGNATTARGIADSASTILGGAPAVR